MIQIAMYSDVMYIVCIECIERLIEVTFSNKIIMFHHMLPNDGV